MKKEANNFALLPIVVFLVLYIGCGVYYEYLRPVEGGMGFYVSKEGSYNIKNVGN